MSERHCTNLSSCELFPLLERGGFLKVWQSGYCRAEFTRCARFTAAKRGEKVPLTLLPSGDHLSLKPG